MTNHLSFLCDKQLLHDFASPCHEEFENDLHVGCPGRDPFTGVPCECFCHGDEWWNRQRAERNKRLRARIGS